jgi:hypothetical protein
MDRFSTRLAASLIEDRHREAAATRNSLDPRPAGIEPSTATRRSQRLAWPIRLRAGTR